MSLWVLAAIFAGAVGIDQLLKWWTVAELSKGSVEVIKGVFSFVFVKNESAAFGLFSGENSNLILIISTFVIMAFVIFAAIKIKFFHTKPMQVLCTLVVAGGIGNLIDRIFRGFVVDFAYFELINFPVFNFADVCITCSAILMAILLLFQKDPQPQTPPEQEQPSDEQ